MSYIDTIKEKARADKKTIVLPETTDRRTLIAASHILEEGIANLILVGNEEKIMDGAGWLEVDLTGCNPRSAKTHECAAGLPVCDGIRRLPACGHHQVS